MNFEKEIKNIDALDVLIAASNCLKTDDVAESLISEDSKAQEIIPLHCYSGNVTAYYVTFDNESYAVVCNNANNPSVIEFGLGGNPLINEILDKFSDEKIVYNNPYEIYTKETMLLSEDIDKVKNLSMFDYYPDLLQKDDELVKVHAAEKDALLHLSPLLKAQIIGTEHILPEGKSDWGFLTASQLPSGTPTINNIPNSGTGWATTGQFRGVRSPNPNNHCGPVAITNLALIFHRRGHGTLVNSRVVDTFWHIYDNYQGDGPNATIANATTRFFRGRGATLRHSGAGTVSACRTAIGNDRPLGFLLANALFSWHWILGTGYRHFSSNNRTYFRIVDGWTNTNDRFHRLASGATWISGTQYWV